LLYNRRMSEVDLHAALHTHFNFPAFRPGQAEAIQHVLHGQHTLVVMPTGSGKSMIYQLAAEMIEPRAPGHRSMPQQSSLW
jgi:superfamily II DNA helicase RecQ